MRVTPAAIGFVLRPPAQLFRELSLSQKAEPGVPGLAEIAHLRPAQGANRKNRRIDWITQAMRAFVDRSIRANQPSQVLGAPATSLLRLLCLGQPEQCLQDQGCQRWSVLEGAVGVGAPSAIGVLT